MTIQINGSTGLSGVDGSAGTPALQGSDSNTGISFGTDTVNINTGGTTRATVDSSGRLLVGTSSSSAASKLVIQGNTGGNTVGRATIAFGGTSPATTEDLGILTFTDSSNGEGALIAAVRDGGTWTSGSSHPTRLLLSTTPDGASAPTQRMTINSSGKVGIGTATPTNQLTVQGASGQLRVSNGTDIVDLGASGNTAYLGTETNVPLYFYTNQVERVRITSTGNFQFNSGYGSVATAYGCRAWVNFNGTGTVAIRGSGNVSSITDNGTGEYTVNFTTAMPDANYSAVGTCRHRTGASPAGNVSFGYNPASGSASLFTSDGATYFDTEVVCVAIFR